MKNKLNKVAVILTLSVASLTFGQEKVKVIELTNNPSDTKTTQASNISKKANDTVYDFEQVITQVQASINPLKKEMTSSLNIFVESVSQAEALFEEGRQSEGIEKCSIAMQSVLDNRDKVLEPMWQGQDYLNEQVINVRERLIKAIGTTDVNGKDELDKNTETILDRIASRIANEKDDNRKKRLIAHYHTIRQLAKIKSISRKLSPDQRKLWGNVLKVLENTALAHQQVLMGTEVMFAQFEAATKNLEEYQYMLETIEGVSGVVDTIGGLGESNANLKQFTSTMQLMQNQMQDLGARCTELLEDKMIVLESQTKEITQSMEDSEQAGISMEQDDELESRIKRLEK
ncbi:MAG: hypothetical protein JEZ07_14385 [Phycisphaerae bacterium]|nr:hypothetical protein [Phycisphaerae bacterium]